MGSRSLYRRLATRSAIEFVELGRGRRRARRDEIAGLRIVPVQYGYRQLVLELRAGKKPLKITWVHETDPVLQAWLDRIPNADAEERARAEAELLRSEALGADQAERALLGHPWGALTFANVFLDRGVPEVFRVAVRGKHFSGGKYTSWNLELDPWGPVTERKDVDVGRQIYGAASVSGRVCVVLHSGALGARWYVVLRCREGKT